MPMELDNKMQQLSENCELEASAPRMGLSPGVLAAIARVQQALQAVLLRGPPSSLGDLAQGLADQGLLVTLRSGLGVGIESPDYLSTLRHTFLICQEGSSGMCVIVDPSFQEQFSVAGMPSSSSYATAVGNLPKVFVGTIGTVNALVYLLTGTLHQESSALGIELPPWRSKQALLSKWLPRRFADAVFTPPSFAPLHPALKSTVHGTLSSSPVSVQSWPSLPRADSRMTSSDGGSSDAGSTCGAVPRDCTLHRLSQEPLTVVRGFNAPSPAELTPVVRPRVTASSTSSATSTCGAAATTCQHPVSSRTCSALTQQLAAAAAASRAVQLQAQDHWQQCLFARAAVHWEASQDQDQDQPQTQDDQNSAQARSQALPDSLGVGDASLGLRANSRSVLQSLVISPVYRCRRSCGSGGVRRGDSSGSHGLKLGSATLKMLPRIYTVKLAPVTAC